MYISFAVFLVTVYLLISSFFKQLANTTFGGSSAVGGVGFSFISLPLPKITAVFLYMAMIEALFAGLVGGKMATGYLKDGLKHAILLMLICFITCVFFVQFHNSTTRADARLPAAPRASDIKRQPGADAVESVSSPLQRSMDQEPDLMGHCLRLHYLRRT